VTGGIVFAGEIVPLWHQEGSRQRPDANFFRILFCFAAKLCLTRAVNVTESIWDRLSRVILALLVMAAILGIFVWYEPVVQENQRMREEKFELDTKIDQELKIAKKLETQLRSFEDPVLERTMVERLARERLSYAKPGENVVHFESPATTMTR
jgi:cell division protein FtsB